ncbi:hypothetical protein BD311DRAFT_805834 [Dichomitus squalens]|uniref:Cytochrome P450 n=1 Tax=Dichomitus squalens TaxID=114155 RepID=A0A4Q9MR64_9APHY|nr:hypothetical protein BD311DRAFT_805834 [Dichomitus squalens]
MTFSLSLSASLGLVSLAVLLVVLWRSTPRQGPLPPGPPRLPLVGNLLDIPKISPWVAYRDLSRKYGKILSLAAFGQTLIIVDDTDIAVELLEKRSLNYSSRPESHMVALVSYTRYD